MRTDESRRKALEAIEALKKKNEPVNFSTVQKKSGVSKHYLYEHEEIRAMIELARSKEAERAAAWHKKYDRTSKSKDVLIATKDKRIEKLEEENRQLRKVMNSMKMELLDEKALATVVGGASGAVEGRKKQEFEAAWSSLNMDGQNISGMKKAEIYDDWEFAGYTPDAVSFLIGIKNS